MNELKIGWSEVSITPDRKVFLQGQFAERISEYVEKPCTVTALALENGCDQAVICSVDVVLMGYPTLEGVRARLQGRCPGLDVNKIILTAIHTHTAPTLPAPRQINKHMKKPLDAKTLLINALPEGRRYVDAVSSAGQDVMGPAEYHPWLMDRIAQAIEEAWSSREKGSFVNAFGRAAVGMCRRVTYTDGSAQMWGDTYTTTFSHVEGGSDTGIELLYVFGAQGQLTGVVANLSCPAQCVQHRMFISPDFWGEAKLLVRKHFGEEVQLLALCGPAGDQCPVDLVRWVQPESDLHDPNLTRGTMPKRKADPSMFDLAGMRKAGKRVAREIIDVFEEGLDPAQEAPRLTHTVETWELPLRRVTPAEVERSREEVRQYLERTSGDVNYIDAANLQRPLGILSRAEVQEHMQTIEMEAHVIRLGTVAIATNPFELYLDFANQIRVVSPAEQTVLIQLANGSEGYLPTEKAEKAGHYSAFVASGQVGHEGGDLLVRHTLRTLNKLFKED